MTAITLTPETLARIKDDPVVRRELVQKSHYWFFSIYFGHYITYEMADFHKELFGLSEQDGIPFMVIVAFRGSGKSTIMNLSYPIWSVVSKRKKKFVIILSQTKQQARQHLLNLKRELETNALLAADLGPFESHDDEWGSLSLVLKDYDAKIIAASTEQSVRGLRHGPYRPDLIICDDLEDLQSVKTKESRNKAFNWFTGDIVPLGIPDTQIVVVGNLLHEDSLLMRMKEGLDSGAREGEFRAYPLLKSDNTIAWPGKYKNQADIERLKSATGSEAAWNREYLLRIISDHDRVVHPDWIRTYKVLPDKNDYWYSAVGVDLAVSEKNSGDYTAMVAAQIYEKDGEIYVYIMPDPINIRAPFPTSLEVAKQLVVSVHDSDIAQLYVEDAGLQRWFIQALETARLYVEGFPVSRMGKRERLALTTPAIKSAKILFPEKGAEDLITQLVGFGVEKHDDLADAFSTLILKIQEHGKPAMPEVFIL